ncbi:MAG: acyl carrier protein [Oscillospiraceae bacterium]|jgi:acyl carrier protein|nr:acyl carrier protein [Oscillospiraceae bacterium]
METFEKLQLIIADVLGIRADAISIITPESTPRDLEANSIDMIDIVGEAEQTFQVEVPDEALEAFETVGDMVAYLDAHS